MENYVKKAADAFLVERPYGMRVDYRNGTVSFRKIKGCRTPDFTGCHKAVSVYLAFITEKEGK